MKSKLLFLFIIPALLYIVLLPAMPLMEPDEARYSDIPSMMNSTGDYVTPHLKHVVYLEKPPLCYWATALSFKLFGENDFSSRLFVGLCAWGCIILAYFMGTFFGGEKSGLYSAGVLTTFLFHFVIGRLNILDVPLAFFVCLAVWTGYRHVEGGGEGKSRLYLLYLFCALAFLTKGLIGIAFPFAILVLWLLTSLRWRDILSLFSPVGILIIAAVSAPWILLAQAANKDFLWFFFVQEHFLRYTTTMHGKENSLFYYVPIIIAGTLPWCAFLVKAIPRRNGKTTPFRNGIDLRFLLTWVIFIFAFFSLSSSKLVPYMTPLFPPLAVIFGYIFSRYEERAQVPAGKKTLFLLPIIIQSSLFIILLCVPPFIERHHITIGEWLPLIAIPLSLQILIIFLPDAVGKRWNGGWFTTIYILSAVFLASLLVPLSHFLTPYKSAYPVTQAARSLLPADKELFQYGISLYGIDFYTKMRTPVVDDFGELGYGIGKLPLDEKSRYFLKSDDFFRLCKEVGDIYCVTKYKRRVEKIEKHVQDVEVLWSNGAFYILRLRC